MSGSCPEIWIYKKIPHAWGQGRSKGERGKKQMPQRGADNLGFETNPDSVFAGEGLAASLDERNTLYGGNGRI